MKFSIAIALLLFYSLLFVAIPIHHLISNSTLERPALKVSLDALSSIIGLSASLPAAPC